MARVRIDLPDAFPFRTDLAVRVGDVNYGGHLGNDAVLALAQEARLRFLAGHGLSELDAGGPGLLMADAAVVYRSQAFRGDILTVSVAVTEVGRRSCEMVYAMRRRDTGEEVARVKTGLVFYDYGAGRLAETPAAFRALASLPGAPVREE